MPPLSPPEPSPLLPPLSPLPDPEPEFPCVPLSAPPSDLPLPEAPDVSLLPLLSPLVSGAAVELPESSTVGLLVSLSALGSGKLSSGVDRSGSPSSSRGTGALAFGQ